MRYNAIDWLAFVLIIIGAVNWGLVGAFDFNLVTELFGVDSALSNTIFVLVGLAGVYSVYALMKQDHYHTTEVS